MPFADFACWGSGCEIFSDLNCQVRSDGSGYPMCACWRMKKKVGFQARVRLMDQMGSEMRGSGIKWQRKLKKYFKYFIMCPFRSFRLRFCSWKFITTIMGSFVYDYTWAVSSNQLNGSARESHNSRELNICWMALRPPGEKAKRS